MSPRDLRLGVVVEGMAHRAACEDGPGCLWCNAAAALAALDAAGYSQPVPDPGRVDVDSLLTRLAYGPTSDDAA